MASKYHVRFINLPSSSHPSTLRIEKQLNKLETWESMTSTSKHVSIRLCLGLALLEDLHTCLDDLLNLCSTQQLISHNEVEKSIEELYRSFFKILDISGLTRDTMSQIEENVQSLHFVLRRRKRDLSIERRVKEYAFFTKKMKEDAKKLIIDLKILHSKFGMAPFFNEVDHHLSSLIRVLSGAILMNISMFKYLLSFLAMPAAKLNAARWLVATRLMHEEFIGWEENSENVNELWNQN